MAATVTRAAIPAALLLVVAGALAVLLLVDSATALAPAAPTCCFAAATGGRTAAAAWGSCSSTIPKDQGTVRRRGGIVFFVGGGGAGASVEVARHPAGDGLPTGGRLPTSSLASSTSSSIAEEEEVSPAGEKSSGFPPSSEGQTRRDVLTAGSHLLLCSVAAVAVSAWEDLDCSYLKPETTALRRGEFWGAATRGMGRGRTDRLPVEYEEGIMEAYEDSRAAKATASAKARARARVESAGAEVVEGEVSLPEVPSYNEIMAEHRTSTVPRWTSDPSSLTPADVRRSTSALYSALRTVLKMKPLIGQYAWGNVRSLLESPSLNDELEGAASVLRSATLYVPASAREDIGFHWGSCGWRHCGALADAQEALAELRSRGTGLYEPFEALFVLDVVERSLRDMIGVVPIKWHDVEDVRSTPEYERYISQSEKMAELLGEDYDPDLDDPTIDVDFLNTLRELRSGLGDSEDDESGEED